MGARGDQRLGCNWWFLVTNSASMRLGTSAIAAESIACSVLGSSIARSCIRGPIVRNRGGRKPRAYADCPAAGIRHGRTDEVHRHGRGQAWEDPEDRLSVIIKR